MESLKYVCSATGDELSLNGPDVWSQTAEGVRGRELSYDLGYRSLAAATRSARETSLTLVYVRCPEKADLLRRLMDADAAARTPGTLVADGWQTRVYGVKAEPTSITPVIIEQKVTLVMVDGMWRKALPAQQFHRGETQPGPDLDYPYDYMHDYAAQSGIGTVTNPQIGPMPFTMVIYGPVSDPQITVGGNIYALRGLTIPSGGYLTIDSISRTIVMTAENGDRSNQFGKGVRGSGSGSGEYVFEPIPPGESLVEWSGFGFDLTVWEEESEPPWST